MGRERLQHSLPGPVKLHLAGPSSPQNPLKLPPTSRPWQTISSHSVAAAPGRTLVAAAWTRVSQGNERLHLPPPGAGPATQGPGALGVRLPPARVDRHSRREVNQVATVCCRRACRDPAVRGQVSRPGGHPTRVLQSVDWGNTYRRGAPPTAWHWGLLLPGGAGSPVGSGRAHLPPPPWFSEMVVGAQGTSDGHWWAFYMAL